MTYTVKDWRDSPGDLTTPITAAALEDLETRVSAATGQGSSTDHVRYVSKTGSDSNTGYSPAYPKLTINGAISSIPAGGGATIYVGAGDYNENVAMNQIGLRIIGVSHPQSAFGKVVRITSPNTTSSTVVVSAVRCALENVMLRGSSGTSFTGTVLELQDADFSVFRNLLIQNDDNAATSTTGGTGISHDGPENCEGCVFDNVFVYECNLGLWLGTQSVNFVFMNFRGGANYKDILIDGQAGGNVFIGSKFNNSRSRDPDYTVDIGGASPAAVGTSEQQNVFIMCDWSEHQATPVGNNKVRVSCHFNHFIRGTSSSGTSWDVTGSYNIFDNFRLQGQTFNVSGDHNVLNNFYMQGGSLTDTGSHNIVQNERGTWTPGSSTKRAFLTSGAAAVAATTPGAVVKKRASYDKDGNLEGYVPIYNTIT